jgi:hypothetical protein
MNGDIELERYPTSFSHIQTHDFSSRGIRIGEKKCGSLKTHFFLVSSISVKGRYELLYIRLDLHHF